MSTLAILSLLFATAAIFGLVSSRWLRLPITIGTMLLTVLVSATLTLAATRVPGIHNWAVGLMQQIDFEKLILHGMLPLLLFAGAFLLDLEQLAREKLAVLASCDRRHRNLLPAGSGAAAHAQQRPIAMDAVPHLRRAHLAHRSDRGVGNAAARRRLSTSSGSTRR